MWSTFHACANIFQMAGRSQSNRPRRITELANELTTHIDAADPLGIVRQLGQSDAQLFAGWGSHASVNDVTVIEKLFQLSQRATEMLKENKDEQKKNIFVFSGCGTSGRMAWLCSRAYNRILGRFDHTPCFNYLIAGGDKALIVGDELPEDDPPRGAEDLKRISQGADHVMYIGITCGLSAPYIAGQLDYAMHQSNMTCVLVGFNPVSLSRDAPIEKWNKTCREVFVELETMSKTTDRAVILNPIVGPEPITGSSRMKGGSMTVILLDTIFLTALQSFLKQPITTSLLKQNQLQDHHHEDGWKHSLPHYLSPIYTILDCYTLIYQTVYRHSHGIAALMDLAASCLCQLNGRLFYLGSDTLGAMGLIDASEMVSTYGASLDEIRGFVEGGWETCRNIEGDMSGQGKLFRVSVTQFESDLLHTLTSHDCVIIIINGTAHEPRLRQTTADKVLASPAKCGLLVITDSTQTYNGLLDNRYDTTFCLRLPHYHAFEKESVFAGFGLKLVLNGVSTGANIMKGRVYGNTMINLTLSNDKLFYRAVGIIQEMNVGISSHEATTALLQAIYKEDNVAKYYNDPVSSHISAARPQNMVVPLALLLASGVFKTLRSAEMALLHNTHNIRHTVAKQIDGTHLQLNH